MPATTTGPDRHARSKRRYRLLATTYGEYPVIATLMRSEGDPLTLKIRLHRAIGAMDGAPPGLAAANNYIAAR